MYTCIIFTPEVVCDYQVSVRPLNFRNDLQDLDTVGPSETVPGMFSIFSNLI